MKRSFTQKEIFELLKSNPLNVKVHTGDLDDLNGEDYIFFDSLSDDLIASDNSGSYVTEVQFTVFCKNFDDRKRLVNFLKQNFVGRVNRENDIKNGYFLARMRTELFING